MQDTRLRRMTLEDPIARQRREDRERDHANHPVPGMSSKSAAVFHWEEDPETGVRMQVPVYRKVVNEFWEWYSNKQRWYDAYYGEWDVCTEFDPESTYPDGYDDDDDDMDDFYMGDMIDAGPKSPSPPRASSPPPVSKPPSPPHVQHSSTDIQSFVTFPRGLSDLLYE